jgi:hypothetical protein
VLAEGISSEHPPKALGDCWRQTPPYFFSTQDLGFPLVPRAGRVSKNNRRPRWNGVYSKPFGFDIVVDEADRGTRLRGLQAFDATRGRERLGLSRRRATTRETNFGTPSRECLDLTCGATRRGFLLVARTDGCDQNKRCGTTSARASPADFSKMTCYIRFSKNRIPRTSVRKSIAPRGGRAERRSH